MKTLLPLGRMSTQHFMILGALLLAHFSANLELLCRGKFHSPPVAAGTAVPAELTATRFAAPTPGPVDLRAGQAAGIHGVHVQHEQQSLLRGLGFDLRVVTTHSNVLLDLWTVRGSVHSVEPPVQQCCVARGPFEHCVLNTQGASRALTRAALVHRCEVHCERIVICFFIRICSLVCT